MLDHNEKLIDRAIEAQEKGDFILAAELYLQLLKVNPRDPDANHNLGILNIQLGRFDDSILFLENAINSNSTVLQYWISLADTLIKLDRTDDAEQIIQQAIELGHDDPIFKNMLQYISHAKQGNDDEDEKAIFLDPPRKIIKKIKKLAKSGETKKFSKLLLDQLEAFPNSPNLNEIAGHAFRANEELTKAEGCFDIVLQSNDDRLASYLNLAVVHIELEKFGHAIDILNKAKLIFPDESRIFYNLGVAYSGEGLFKEAIALYSKALDLNDNFFDAYINLANAYGEVGRIDDSIEVINRAVQIAPERYEVHYNLGHYLKIKGEFDLAKTAYSKSLDINPNFLSSHHALASLTKYTKDTTHLFELEKLQYSSNLDGDLEMLHYSLAKAYEDTGDIKKSFQHYEIANTIRNKTSGYDRLEQRKLMMRIREDSKVLRSISIDNSNSKDEPVPIFIVGMPRSGTTLVEQIISSHKLVAPAGELPNVQYFNVLLSSGRVPVSEMQISVFRKSYLRELEQYRDKELFVTDKLPSNFMHIPLIKCAFPKSKIVHVKRNPAATCWSNYTHAFTKNALRYSYTLENIVDFYTMYEDTMTFWENEYPGQIHTVDYEKLVVDTEHETKKLIQAVELYWDESCLEPQKNIRSVKTSSQMQVRKKVYSGSSDNWKKFEPFLDGAFDKLIHK